MRALIVVDVQNDFLPGGALAVPCGDEVIPVINELIRSADLVVATQDWHPADHSSFASQHDRDPGEAMILHGVSQILWPDHCVQGTPGAAFAAALDSAAFRHVARKGTDPAVDSYSGFFDNGHRHATDLHDRLRQFGVESVDVVGLATDYCVKCTAIDAADLGYDVTVLTDACRGVNVHPGDVDRALDELVATGVTLATSAQRLPSQDPA